MADMTREQAVEGAIRDALRKAFRFGENYWADADSESYAANRRSVQTMDKFKAWADETCAALTALTAQQAGEAVAWARNSGDENDDAFVISAKVKRLWMASNPKRVERYTRPLYTTHVPCWALPAVESALSMLDLQGYWHSDLAAFRDWLKEKSV